MRARRQGHRCVRACGLTRSGSGTSDRELGRARAGPGRPAGAGSTHLQHHGGGQHAAARKRSADRSDRRSRPDRHQAGDPRLGCARRLRFHEPAAECRPPQRNPGQPVSGRRELSRLHGVATARHAAGPLGVSGRRACQPAVRRHRQLGSHSASGDLVRRVDAGIESAVRTQHARWCAVTRDEEWRPRFGHAGAGDLRQSYAASRRIRARRIKGRRSAELVFLRQCVQRGWLARRFSIGRGASVRQARMAAAADRCERERRLCLEHVERKWSSGDRLPGS